MNISSDTYHLLPNSGGKVNHVPFHLGNPGKAFDGLQKADHFSFLVAILL